MSFRRPALDAIDGSLAGGHLGEDLHEKREKRTSNQESKEGKSDSAEQGLGGDQARSGRCLLDLNQLESGKSRASELCLSLHWSRRFHFCLELMRR